MNDNSEKSTSGLIDLIKGLSIPEWITKNAITAIGKGIHGVIGEAFEIPKNALKNYNERVKLIGELKREYVKKAAQHPLKQIESDPDLASRILSSYSSKLFEEQLNKESIALKTVEKLSGADFSSTAPTGDEIGYDWLTEFWNLAANRTEDEIQEILSKILVNEIAQPKSLSLHTLQTLSILDSKVGNSFRKLCRLSIDDGATAYIIHPHVFAFQDIGPLNDYGITFSELLSLDGANLIRSTESIRLNFGKSDGLKVGEREYEEIDYAGKNAKIDVGGEQLNLIYFTQAGRELRKLLEISPLDNYTRVLQDRLKDRLIIE